MKRAVAVIAAIAMITGAIAIRSRTGGGVADRPVSLTVGCASVVAEPCRRWAGAEGFRVVVLRDPPPLTGYPVERETDVGSGLDVVVAPEPFAGMAFQSSSTPVPAAVSPVVVVIRAGDTTRMQEPATAWSDAIDADSRLWIEPPDGWLGPVVVAGLVAAELALDAGGGGLPVPAIDSLAANDLSSDAALDALADLTAARRRANDASPTARDAIGAMVALAIDVVGTVEAAAGKRETQRVVTPTPEVSATISIAWRSDLADRQASLIRSEALTARLTAGLAAAGYRAPATGTGPSVAPALLIGLAQELRS